MSSYRTKKQAVVHAPKSAKAFTPYCQLDYRNESELKNTLALYMKQFCSGQKIEIDTAAGQILVNGEYRYDYELIDPVRPRPTPGALFP
ncbi:hypothetical protein MB46_10285 [Arthrobacter alpinus]|uniref:hypothetical protein n=1 Tax=Arthrobacter alpinus TaxID=656366 RepID=UPI0005C8C4B7|nr:hypothetical protein [Arthrobacter alpinus]ALV45808.1 hypothetical protein MB46_10285 [Arthrobacter alpinus]